MPYPDGIKSFNRSRPIEIGHFESIKNGGTNVKKVRMLGK